MKFRVEGIYDAKKLGIPQMLILGLQHMFAMFGATILVPILVNNYFHGEGLSIQVTLFCAGFGTLLFHVLTKLKVPAFLGSSFAFLGGFATVAELDTGIFANMSYGEKLPYACGGVFVAGLLYLVLAMIVKVIGVKRVMRYLPPVVTGPIIICIGLSLAPSAISNASQNWILALIALGTVIFFNIWGVGMFRIIPILMGIVVSYVVALIMNALGMTNADGSAILSFAGVASAPIVGVPKFFLCKFNITAILAMAPIAIASMMEHIGDISAISATVDRNFIEDPGLHRSIFGDNFSTMVSGLIGSVPTTTYGENIGVMAVTKVYSVQVIAGAAVISIICSFIGKLSTLIQTIPGPVIGGISFLLYGMIGTSGLRILVDSKVDYGKNRNQALTAVIFVTGLSGIKVNFGNVQLTGMVLACVVGMILSLIFYLFDKMKLTNDQ